MELAQILVQLWRRRLAVVAVVAIAFVVSIALAYKISISPPGLSHRSISNGSAETHILVDSPRSSVADLNRSFDPLVQRAQVFAQLMTTAPVIDRIAKIAGVPASSITASDDNSTLNVPTSEIEPTANVRANQITNETLRYRITFRAEPEQPTVTVFGQAPTAEAAIKITNAAAKGAAQWVRDTQDRQLVPDSRRTQLTQLGAATGGTVNSGASRILAVLVFVAIVAIGSMLVLLLGNTLPAVRERRRSVAKERVAALPTTGPAAEPATARRAVNGNGNGTRKQRAARTAAAGAAAKSQAQAQERRRASRGA